MSAHSMESIGLLGKHKIIGSKIIIILLPTPLMFIILNSVFR